MTHFCDTLETPDSHLRFLVGLDLPVLRDTFVQWFSSHRSGLMRAKETHMKLLAIGSFATLAVVTLS
jgi:hypothetical protein